MDAYIHEEAAILFGAIDDLVEKQPEQKEVWLNIHGILPAMTINTLWYIIAGVKNDLEDESFVRLTKLVLEFMRLGSISSPVLLSKFLQKIPIINSSYKKQEDIGDELNNYMKVQFYLFIYLRILTKWKQTGRFDRARQNFRRKSHERFHGHLHQGDEARHNWLFHRFFIARFMQMKNE